MWRQQRNQHTKVRGLQVVRLGHLPAPNMTAPPAATAVTAEPSARALARGPGPIHFAHIEANEMLSADEKIGCRGLGDGAIPLVQQRHVAIPAVGDGRQDEAGRRTT